MTTPQGQVPPPPEGYASWLDYATEGPLSFTIHARAELAALRKELSDTKANWLNLQSVHADAEKECHHLRKELSDTHGLLATARENLVAIDAQRAEAVRERDAYHDVDAALDRAIQERDDLQRQLQDVEIACGGDPNFADGDGASRLANDAVHERDDLRAQVAELNEMGDATAKRLSEMLTNRTHQLNEARDQIQELRAAVLALWKHAPSADRVRNDYNEVEYVEVRVNEAAFFAMDAIVTRLSAEEVPAPAAADVPDIRTLVRQYLELPYRLKIKVINEVCPLSRGSKFSSDEEMDKAALWEAKQAGKLDLLLSRSHEELAKLRAEPAPKEEQQP